MDGFGSSAGDSIGRIRPLSAFSILVIAAIVFLASCVGTSSESSESTGSSDTPITPGSTTADTEIDLEATTTTTLPPLRVSMAQVLGGSVSDDPSPEDEIAVTPPEHPEESYMTAVAAGNSGLVAGGVVYPANAETTDAGVWVSSDGRGWERLEDESGVFGDAMSATGEPGDQAVNDVAGGSLGIIAVGSDGLLFEHDAAIWVSIDSSVWERLTHDADVFGGEGDQFMHSVVQMPGLAVVVGESAGEAAAWVSQDGTQWARAEVNDESVAAGVEPSVMKDVTVGDGVFVAVGSAGVDLGPAVWLSSDGLTWDRLLDSMAGELSGFSTDESAMRPMTAVAAGEQGLVAIGTKLLHDEDQTQAALSTGGPLVWTSVDGYEWQLLDSSFVELTDQEETSRYAYLKRGAPVLLEDVAWVGDRALAIGGYELEPSPNATPSFVTLWASADGGSTWHVAGETTLPPTESPRGARSFTRFDDSLVLVGSDEAPAGKHPDYGWMTYASTPGVWIASLPEE
ncbi:MAG: hypothetical protein ACNYZH_08890 [Acidimicrobiia bacterium]